jgi:hypothetical protein
MALIKLARRQTISSGFAQMPEQSTEAGLHSRCLLHPNRAR